MNRWPFIMGRFIHGFIIRSYPYLHSMKMRIKLSRLNSDLRFKSENEHGNFAIIDGGANAEGLRPMEMLLSALAACSAFDLEHILRKQRQIPEDVKVAVEGTRPDDGFPKPFSDIHMKFSVYGDLDQDKVERAVALSVEKYCSVGATLRPETQISYSLELIRTSALQ
jgi:putative redox protein